MIVVGPEGPRSNHQPPDIQSDTILLKAQNCPNSELSKFKSKNLHAYKFENINNFKFQRLIVFR